MPKLCIKCEKDRAEKFYPFFLCRNFAETLFK